MSDVGWGNSQLNGHAEMASGSRSGNTGISRSQDDAAVEYFFQRPQNENGLQPYGGNKRWAVGDDSIIAQGRSVTDMERDFRAISMDSDFSKKLWEIDSSADGRSSSEKGTGIFSGSPWSPREGPWGSPPDRSVASTAAQPVTLRRPGSFAGNEGHGMLSPPHPSEQASTLGLDMAEYVLGRPSIAAKDSLPIIGQRHSKNNFIGHGEGDADKKMGKQTKTPSPFEPAHDKSDAEKDNNLVQNGLDDSVVSYGRMAGRQESPTVQLQESDGIVSGTSQPLHGPSQLVTTSKQDEPFLDSSDVVVVSTPGHSLQIDPAGGQHYGPLVLDSFVDYPGSYVATVDNAFGTSSFAIPSVNYSQQHHVIRQQQQQQLPPPQQQTIAYLQHHPPQQQHYAVQVTAQQSSSMSHPPSATVSSATQAMPAPFTAAPSYVINSQDPYSMGIPIAGPLHYVQTPWGLYPASLVPAAAVAPPPAPQTAALSQQQAVVQQQQQQHQQQQQQQHHLMLASARSSLQPPNGRPITPSQINSQPPPDVVVGSMGHHPQQQGLPIPHTGVVDFGGYQLIPAYYDQNGQLVVNNSRGSIRLVSPAPVLINAAPQQGFPQPGALAFNTVTGNVFAAAGGLAAMPAQQHQQLMNFNGPSNAVAGAASAVPPDYGLVQRRESYETPGSDKYGRLMHHQAGAPVLGQQQQHAQVYGGGSLAAAAPMLGPLGLVQPAAAGQQPLSPPPMSALHSGGAPALGGFGISSSGVTPQRIYSAAPGAEAKYRGAGGSMHSAGGGLAGHTMAAGGAGPGILSAALFSGTRGLSKGLNKDAGGRSRLLEDFRNNRTPSLTLKDLQKHVVEFSQDQHGSRFIQQKLERATPPEKGLVFNEIISSAYGLMTDVFGNYVIQKFFEFGSTEQKQTLAQRLRGHVLQLALQMYGCRVIQKALESIPPDMQVEIVKELDGHVIKCVKDQNGNHVVQKCIERVEPGHLQFILDAFRGQVFTLSTHPYGCRVIQRTLEHCTAAQTECILDELHEQTERLVQDQYGNYVIQHVLEHGRAEDRSKIVLTVRGKVLALSQHKFASNVVEKCVTHSTRTERAVLIEEVMSEGGSQTGAPLYHMMKDQYANYVVQRMLDTAEPAQRKMLVHKIRPHLATLRKYPYGKHIIAKLDKYLQKGGTNGTDLSPLGMPSPGGPAVAAAASSL